MQIKSRDWQNPMSLSAKYAAYVRNVMWWFAAWVWMRAWKAKKATRETSPTACPIPPRIPGV